MRGRVLLVDNESQQRLALQAELRKAGYEVVAAEDSAAARAAAQSSPTDAIVLSSQTLQAGGADLLAEARAIQPTIPVIAINNHRPGGGDSAVAPRVERAISAARSVADMPDEVTFAGISARSAAMRATLGEMRQLSPLARRVLLVGEAGVGKRMLCDALLRERGCNETAVVRVDFERAAVSDDRSSRRSDLALTLQRMLPGRTGPRTLVLSRVDLATLGEQEALARWMHAWKHFFGETHPHAPICSVIATSTVPLRKLIDGGRYLPALAEQLSTVVIEVPALRDRFDDMPLLAAQHLQKIAEWIAHPAPTLSRDALVELHRHTWPGNVCELQRVLERVAVYSLNSEIGSERMTALLGTERSDSSLPLNDVDVMDRGLNEILAEIERRMIVLALKAADGNQGRAAARLKIPRTTLRDRMAKHKIPMHDA
ncbi:MAG: sigma-54-dependent transcriptional regulator [Phycisphaerae bacterium]